ncbi:MAG: hypothetical protein CUR34_00830 [Sediminibacterium sp.]|nr:MAG: hypothetical protein CUR34_00830 [Sediminibacterium sp.] [Sediminibacterium sp. FEMGT703S]
MLNKSPLLYIDYFFVIIFIAIFSLSPISTFINSITLYIAIPFLFLYSFVKKPNLLIKSKQLSIFLLLLIWSMITIVKSISLLDSIKEIYLILSSFVFSFIIVYFSKRNIFYIKLFYFLFILYFISLGYKAYITGISEIDTSKEQFNTEEINANLLGYFGYFSVVSGFFLWQLPFSSSFSLNKNKVFAGFVFLLCIFLVVISGFFSASRGGILMPLLTCALFLSIKILYPLKFKSIVFLSALIFLVIVVFFSFESLYQESFLFRRLNSTNIEDESRFGLLVEAFNVGLLNPIFGVGPANFFLYTPTRHYSHSTYFEIFANNGLVGLIIFVTILFNFAVSCYNLFCINDINIKRISLFFFVFILSYSLYNFLYVFHVSLYLIGFFFLVQSHLDYFKKSFLK